MRAAVTKKPGELVVEEVEAPAGPGEGEVVLRPELVGVCGSDLHLFKGHLDIAPAPGRSSLYPLIQGHEVSAVVEELGPGAATGGLAVGDRVALWPLSSCGTCYPCRINRASVCDAFELVGIHRDGGLAEHLVVAADHVFPIGELPAPLGAFVEPMAVAAHAVARAKVEPGEPVVVLGGGPIGLASLLAAKDRGARVALVEPLPARRRLASRFGAELVLDAADPGAIEAARAFSGGEGAPVVLDTTGSPAALRGALEMVASAGRVVVVGLSGEDAPLPLGRFTDKEFDLVGSSCHEREDVERAVEVVTGSADLLAPELTVEFPLGEAAEAVLFAAEQPEAAMKVFVRVTS